MVPEWGLQVGVEVEGEAFWVQGTQGLGSRVSSFSGFQVSGCGVRGWCLPRQACRLHKFQAKANPRFLVLPPGPEPHTTGYKGLSRQPLGGYKGNFLMRNCPHTGPYSRPVPWALWMSYGVGIFL